MPGLADMHIHMRMDAVEHAEEFLYTSLDGFGVGMSDLEAFLSVYYARVERLADAENRALIVREVAASGMYVDPTLIIYNMIYAWVDDEQLATLHTDKHHAYLPRGTRDEYLNSALRHPGVLVVKNHTCG